GRGATTNGNIAGLWPARVADKTALAPARPRPGPAIRSRVSRPGRRRTRTGVGRSRRADAAPRWLDRSRDAGAEYPRLMGRISTFARIRRWVSCRIGEPGPAVDATPVSQNSGKNDRMIRRPVASN